MDNGNTINFESEAWSTICMVKSMMQKYIEPIVQSEGLNMFGTFILFAISQGMVTSVGDIAKELYFNQGNASTICKSLESSGYITRNRSKKDERVVMLSLTEQGAEKIARLCGRISVFDKAPGGYPEEKLKAIKDGLNELEQLIKFISKNQSEFEGKLTDA